MLRLLWILAAFFSLGTVSAKADPLTCSAFRDRLSGALLASGDPGVEMPLYQPGRTTPDGGGRLTWKTTALAGSLACGPGDSFAEFYATLPVASRDQFAEQLKRLVSIDGAAICAVAAASPALCNDVGKLLLQGALQQMSFGSQRGVPNPSGLRTATLHPTIKAELTAAPSLITFSLAAKEGATIDTVRPPLSGAEDKAKQP